MYLCTEECEIYILVKKNKKKTTVFNLWLSRRWPEFGRLCKKKKLFHTEWNLMMLTDTTHLTLECFVSNSHLDVRTWFTAALLCRLLENERERGVSPLCSPRYTNAEMSGADNIITPKLKHQLLETLLKAHNGEGICSSKGGKGTLPYSLTSRAAGREATKETAELCLLCFLYLACWVLTAKYYSGPLTE